LVSNIIIQIGDDVDKKLDETLILEVLAGGGKVCISYFVFYYGTFRS